MSITIVTKRLSGVGSIYRISPPVQKGDGSLSVDEVTIKGFASVINADREGDEIDPSLFDIKTFLGNPQILYDHQKWVRTDGNAVSVGLVEEAYAAEVVKGKGTNELDIVRMDTGAVVDTLSDDDRKIAKVGLKGLWVVCKIIEPDVVALVRDGRLNSFSWGGQFVYDGSTGPLKRIDLIEVSVVHLPMNAKARFVIAKAFTDSPSLLVQREDGEWAEMAGPIDERNSMMKSGHTADKFGILAVRGTDGKCSYTDTTYARVGDAEKFALTMFKSNETNRSILLLKHSGRVTSDGGDIHEVVQAFTRSVKSLELLEPSSEGTPTQDDKATLTDAEQAAIGDVGDTGASKGGEEQMQFTDDEKKSILGIPALLAGLSDRLTALETKSADPNDDDDADDDATDDAADGSTDNADAGASADDADATQIKGLLTEVNTHLKDVTNRLGKLEKLRKGVQRSAQITEGEDDEAEEPVTEAIAKGLKTATKEERNRVADTLLDKILTAPRRG